MTPELIAGIVALIVTLVGGGVGWSQIKRHGAETEERKEAEGDAKDLKKQLDRRTDPLPPDSVYYERLRRAKERLARLRDRTSK